MAPRLQLVFSFIIAAVLLTIAFIRDLGYEKLYPGDLRNRVVGARLIHDGQSPYFYKWKPQDGMRYYDPESFTNSIITNTGQNEPAGDGQYKKHGNKDQARKRANEHHHYSTQSRKPGAPGAFLLLQQKIQA